MGVRTRGFLVVLLIVPIGMTSAQVVAAQLSGPADSPAPMFQIDVQNSGQSDDEVPSVLPELLWKEKVDPCQGSGSPTDISIDSTGRLIFLSGNCLVAFDPADRDVDWTYPLGSYATPLVVEGDSIFIGAGNKFLAVSSEGQLLWQVDLGGPLITQFGSATIGPNGDIYFNHNGLWSFTPDGDFNWVQDAGTITRSHPAIDSSGNLYDSVAKYKSFAPDGSLRWTTDFPNPLWMLSIGPDDTVYAAGCAGKLFALHPADGSIIWEYTIPDPPPPPLDCPDMLGPAITPAGMLVFAYKSYSEVYAVNPDGTLKWIYDKEGAYIFEPLRVDAGGNSYFCAVSSRCTALDADGQVIWEYIFPQTVYETDVRSMTSLAVASDQVFYLLDSERQIEAFTYPALIPHLFADTEALQYWVDSWDSTPIVAEIGLSSTVAPISWTASITHTSWIALSTESGSTPEILTMTIQPGELLPGVYHDILRILPQDLLTTWLEPITLIKTEDMMEDWIEIPITVYVGTDYAYLPVINPHYEYTLYYWSLWPETGYLSSVDERGGDHVRRSGYPGHGLPDWSPNGEWLVFPESVDGERDLYLMKHDGSEKHQLTLTTEEEYEPQWSPDGEWILYMAGLPNQHRQIFKIRPDGTDKTLVANQPMFLEAFWSPDSSMIAATDHFTTWIMNADGSNLKVLIDDHFSDRIVGWSPDGSKLLLEVHVFNGTGGDIATINVSGTGFKNLTETPGIWDDRPRWSPDGRRIAFVSQLDGDQEVMIMNADGSGLVQLTDNESTDRNPQWSPDSTRISYETDRNGKFEVFVSDLLGNVIFYISSFAQNEFNLSWELSR